MCLEIRGQSVIVDPIYKTWITSVIIAEIKTSLWQINSWKKKGSWLYRIYYTKCIHNLSWCKKVHVQKNDFSTVSWSENSTGKSLKSVFSEHQLLATGHQSKEFIMWKPFLQQCIYRKIISSLSSALDWILYLSSSQISDSSFMYPRPSRLEMLAIGVKWCSPFPLKSTAEWLLLAVKGLPDSGPRSFISEVLLWMCMYSADCLFPSLSLGRCANLKHPQRPWLQIQNMTPIRPRQSSDSRATATSKRVTLPVSLWFSGDNGSSWSRFGTSPGAAVFRPWIEPEEFVTSLPGVAPPPTPGPEASCNW